MALTPTAPARDKLIDVLNGSAYGENVLPKAVANRPGLTNYLLKEATPQAQFQSLHSTSTGKPDNATSKLSMGPAGVFSFLQPAKTRANHNCDN